LKNWEKTLNDKVWQRTKNNQSLWKIHTLVKKSGFYEIGITYQLFNT